MKMMEGTVTEEAFISILMLDGEGTITADSENISYKKWDSLLCYLVCWEGEKFFRRDAFGQCVLLTRRRNAPAN